MLTTVKAYSAWESADTLLLDDAGRAETDLLQIRDITGLEPVAAAINTIAYGFLDGESYSGSSVGRRNIVLMVKPNPNWIDWTYERLRRILYTYFMPKSQVRLIFETDEISPVEITGYVESITPAIFSKEGEIQISIICPYPYFTSVDPTIVTGVNNDTPVEIDYDGSIETGINVEVLYVSGAAPIWIAPQVGPLDLSTFVVLGSVDASKYFVMNSVNGNKYVHTVNSVTGVITNLLPYIQPSSVWPMLKYGPNDFSVITGGGVQSWTLTYYKRYGGL